MTTKKFPMRYALLAAALMQAYPYAAEAAKKGSGDAPECEDCPDMSGKSGWLEVGIAAQSDDAYHFGRYTGHEEEGGLLNASGEYRYRAKENGGYLDLRAEDLGLESRELAVETGRQGKYGIAVEYDQIPNFREPDTRSPFRREGDGVLGLPPGWIAGGSTSTMPTLAADATRIPMQTERDRLGIKFVVTPDTRWEFSGHFRREDKDGVKDTGGTIGFNQTSVLPVPVSTRTDDFGLALGYRGDRLQASMAYDGSLFRNDFARIAWDNPFSAFPSSPAGQMADAPDNEFHQWSAMLGYQVSDATRLTARLASGRMTQNDALLPYTVNPGIVTGALPTARFDGEVETTLAKVEINSRPTSKLRLDASYTYSDRDNKSSVDTYDYVVTDILSGGLRQNRPYSFEQHLLRAKMGYRLPKDMDLSIGFDHDKMDRTFQQAEETKDKTLWAKLKTHPLDSVEASVKLSHSDRDASPYTPAANENTLMRAHNLADRERDKVGVEVAVTPNDKLSVGADMEFLKDDYANMFLGLREATGMTWNLNATYVFSDRLSANAFYGYERLTSDQAGSARIDVPPVDEPWLEYDRNLTQTLGFGFNWKAIPDKLDVGADVVYADYAGQMRYAGAPDLPKLGARLTGVGVHGVYKLKENMSMRVGYRYERYKESDWAKNGELDAIATLLSLGAAPQDYATHLVTVALRYEFK
jgi:MtrB/PioB family decaheme-associated outer membrane protein